MAKMKDNHFKVNWEKTKVENRKIDRLTDQRIKSNIEKKLRNRRALTIGIRSAAAAAILIGLLFTIFPLNESNSNNVEINYYSSTDASKKVELPDGSIVVLEPNSSLVLSENFNQKDRNVIFKGKGVFEIAKDKTRPFNINAESFSVQVLGTKFYLDQTAGEGKVDLFEGKVKVDHKGSITYLRPNESWKESAEKNIASKEISNLLERREFSFNDEILDNIIDELEETYQVQISYPQEFSDNRIKGSFSGNLEEVLTAIGYPFNLKPQKLSGNKIELK